MQQQPQPQGPGRRLNPVEYVKYLLNSFVKRAIETVVGLIQLKPKAIKDFLIFALIVVTITPTGIVLPTPLIAPKHKVIAVPTYDSVKAVIYSYSRHRFVKSFSLMTEPNRNYLIRSWTDSGKITRRDRSNGFHPPNPALVFVQNPKDVEKLEIAHSNIEEKMLGKLNFEALDKIAQTNGGKIDVWVVSPENVEGLKAFFKEFCSYRPVGIVGVGSASSLVFRSLFDNDKSNLFPIFVKGVFLVDPEVESDFVTAIPQHLQPVASSLRISIAGKYTSETKQNLEKVFPDTVTTLQVTAALDSPFFLSLVSETYMKWIK